MSDHASEQHWETSIYPFIISVGILFLIPLAFAFQFVYKMPMLAVFSFGIGVILTVYGVAGWVGEAVSVKTEVGLTPVAMPWFILAEAFIFIGFFAAYWVTRITYDGNWPPPGTPAHMPILVPIIMTVILLASSVTIHVAETKLEKGDNSGFMSWLIITIILGIFFLGFSAKEWSNLFGEGFYPKTNIYATSFFSITGFHASHVLVGICAFIAVALAAAKGKIHHTFTKSASIYWHFVDIIWFFVVTQIYFW
ncbi:MAG: heme-copper oxidase subunit III [Deltaproteobacteria bacterium]|nr:heme-copper oxidase subunit III [Deltaproteobacteria bacterium]